MSDDNKPNQDTSSVVNIALSKEELTTLVNLMNVCSQTFKMLAEQAVQQNDEQSTAVFTARQHLSRIYADKLAISSIIGEPPSRDLH